MAVGTGGPGGGPGPPLFRDVKNSMVTKHLNDTNGV